MSTDNNEESFFFEPSKRVLTKEDLAKFIVSSTHEDIINFIQELAESVRGKVVSAPIETTPFIDSLLSVLDKIDDYIKEFPVVDDTTSNKKNRFGKPEFKLFYDKVENTAQKLLLSLSLPKESIIELKTYLVESWGNRTRIDYGSGHELNFLSFLLCLNKLGNLFTTNDYSAIVLRIFVKYLKIMRTLQTTYWLEPAGSHGVWGLDDYQFLPFLFGAYQLSTHEYMRPKSIHDNEVVEMFKDDYLYFGCIYFINQTKTTALLRWHSPMLDDISGVRTWEKVSEGMTKMYKAEVLAKLPIIQHFYFGSLLPAPEGVSPLRDHQFEVEDDCGHIHNTEQITGTWGDCCGIPVPSSIGARQEESKQKLRKLPFPLPFD